MVFAIGDDVNGVNETEEEENLTGESEDEKSEGGEDDDDDDVDENEEDDGDDEDEDDEDDDDSDDAYDVDSDDDDDADAYDIDGDGDGDGEKNRVDEFNVSGNKKDQAEIDFLEKDEDIDLETPRLNFRVSFKRIVGQKVICKCELLTAQISQSQIGIQTFTITLSLPETSLLSDLIAEFSRKEKVSEIVGPDQICLVDVGPPASLIQVDQLVIDTLPSIKSVEIRVYGDFQPSKPSSSSNVPRPASSPLAEAAPSPREEVTSPESGKMEIHSEDQEKQEKEEQQEQEVLKEKTSSGCGCCIL